MLLDPILCAVGVASIVVYEVVEVAAIGAQQRFQRSKPADAHAFANKVVALLHSFATVSFAVVVLATLPYSPHTKLFDLRHQGVAVLVIWEVAYLLHDTWSMMVQKWRYKRPLDSLVMIHHVGLSLLLPVYYLYLMGDFYLAALYLQNASTPLLHGRYMLLKSQFKGSALHKCCAVSLLVVFFSVRILVWPVLFTARSYEADFPLLEICKYMRSYCLLTSAAMCGMNMVWWLTLFSKIMKIDMRIQHRPPQLPSKQKGA